MRIGNTEIRPLGGVGPGAVEVIVEDPGTGYLRIPNQGYVNNVVALMS